MYGWDGSPGGVRYREPYGANIIMSKYICSFLEGQLGDQSSNVQQTSHCSLPPQPPPPQFTFLLPSNERVPHFRAGGSTTTCPQMKQLQSRNISFPSSHMHHSNDILQTRRCSMSGGANVELLNSFQKACKNRVNPILRKMTMKINQQPNSYLN